MSTLVDLQPTRHVPRALRTRALTTLTLAALLASGMGIAQADDVSNDLDMTVDAVAEVMPLNAGGANGTTTLYLINRNGDGKPGCNLSSGSLVLSLGSSNTSAATVSPSSVTFDSCGDEHVVTITPVAAGTATISALQTSNTSEGSFNIAPVTFTVNVAPAAPSNTAPGIAVSGVVGGASYTKGSVPAATCRVTDAEDGPSSFPATLSGITGDYSANGYGSQTASCSYTDRGGLTASASETYNVVSTAPSVAVAGVTGGASYDVGSVPAANCDVTDAEDGNSSFAATLSAITGPHASDGIGSQTASCSYTDGGGLTASASETYSVVDSSAPVISYTLDPVSPTGQNGWYKGNVSLDWSVSEPQSPNSLTTTGCDDQTITTDQTATTYSCSATSAGGSAEAQNVSIKRDGTAPSVSFTSVVAGTVGANGWYRSDVTAEFTAEDTTSGPASATDEATSSGEGTAVSVSSPAFTDNAGNTAAVGTATQAFKIDKTVPATPTFDGGPANGASYYFGSSPAAPTCSSSDGGSGLASCGVTGGGTTVGPHTYTATATDNAGNESKATLSYTVLAWTTLGYYSPVDMGGVLNTVKGGSTVPLKFELFAGATELTSTSAIASFLTQKVSCASGTGTEDAIEIVSTGGTSLRYDSTGGQFIQNWKTPTGAGTCYSATVTAADGSTIKALFKIK